MTQFLTIVAIFVKVGIILHILKFGPRLTLDFLISDEDGQRHLTLTFNGTSVRKLLQERKENKAKGLKTTPASDEKKGHIRIHHAH